MGLRFRIVVILLTLIVVPLFLIETIVLEQMRNMAINQAEKELAGLANAQLARVEGRLSTYGERIDGMRSRTKLRDLLTVHAAGQADTKTFSQLSKILSDAVIPFSGIKAVGIIDISDVLIASSGIVPADFAEIVSHTFKDKPQTFFSHDPDMVMVFAPVVRDDQTLGTIFYIQEPNELLEIFTETEGFGDTGETLVAQRGSMNEAVFLHNRRFEIDKQTQLTISDDQTSVPITHALAKQQYFMADAIDYRGESVVAATRYIPSVDWGLVVKVDQAELLSGWHDTRRTLLLLGFMISLAAAAVALVVAESITRPLILLAGQAKQVSDGKLNVELPRGLTRIQDEVGALARAFDMMVDELREFYRTLEAKVHDRTKELEKKNIDLERAKAALLNVTKDIRSAKKKSDALAADLKKFRQAVNDASDQIVITDSTGVVLYANKAAERMTGYTKKEILGQRPSLWGGEMKPQFYEKMWRTIQIEKKPFVGEFTNRRKDKSHYIVQATISPVFDETGEVAFFVAIERDITREREIDKAKKEFVSLASHQLRTPLSTIGWYTEMVLAGDAGRLTKKQKEYLDEVYQGNQRMVELVNALLNVSRLELGTFMIEPETVDLVSIVSESLKDLQSQVQEKKLKVIIDVAEGVGSYEADRKFMRIIVDNLLTNAVKYTPSGGSVVVSVDINNEKHVMLQVTDTGFGIPEKQQDKIFTKLFRADNVKMKDTSGTGLGLYMVKQILEHVDGHISFESSENKGTTFTVVLPAQGMRRRKGEKTLK